MARTLILGGGFGGLAVADELRKALPTGHEIILVDASPDFVVGATKTWVMLGHASEASVRHKRAAVEKRGVTFVQATIDSINASEKSIVTSKGTLSGDHMVIALGANLNMGAVPGLAEAASSFYTLEDAVRLKSTLAGFKGGRIVLLIPRAPFKCPAAPYECALMLADHFEDKKLSSPVSISVYTVEGAPMATGGPLVGGAVKELLAQAGIAYHPLHKATKADASAKTVSFEDGSSTTYDLLIAIPPHEAPTVVKTAGLLGQSGWIPVDPRTCAVANHPGVFAIGDVSGVPLPGRFKPDVPLSMPKAGVVAEAQGRVVARNILNELGHGPKAEFDGRGYCFLETGDMHAMKGEGDFFAMPNPVMRPTIPDMAQFEGKKTWVAETIERLLGT